MITAFFLVLIWVSGGFYPDDMVEFIDSYDKLTDQERYNINRGYAENYFRGFGS